MSRMASRYSETLPRSPGPSVVDQARSSIGNRVQQAAVLLDLRAPLRRIGAVAIAKEPLEYGARAIFHRQRRGRRAPGQRAQHGAIPALLALADDVVILQTKLERGQLRLLAEFVGGELIDGNSQRAFAASGECRLGRCSRRARAARHRCLCLPAVGALCCAEARSEPGGCRGTEPAARGWTGSRTRRLRPMGSSAA